MRSSKLSSVLLILTCVFLLVSPGVHADTRVVTASVAISNAAELWKTLTLSETVLVEKPLPKEPDGSGALAGYVLTSMQAWMPPPNKMAGKASHLAEIALDASWTVLEEPEIWRNSDRSKEAILLVRIAWFETMFRDYVDEGYCQLWAQQCMSRGTGCNLNVLRDAVAKEHAPILSINEARKRGDDAVSLMQLGTCDGGQAVGIHQVHYPYQGIALMADGSWHNADFFTKEPKEIVKKSDALVTPDMDEFQRRLHRRTNMRVALAMARQSVKHTGGLINYVGGEGPERAVMAAMRFDSAMAWSIKHPFVRK